MNSTPPARATTCGHHEQDRIGRNNTNLLGAKQVAEIVRTLAVGIDGRIGRRREDELNENALVQQTNDFLDVLLEAFPPLARVADGELSPEELRKTKNARLDGDAARPGRRLLLAGEARVRR